MSQDVWVITKGQTGAVRIGWLQQYNSTTRASEYVDLSQFDSVTVIASRSATSTPVISSPAVIDPDQVTNKGKLSFTFDADDANVPVHELGYLLSFKCMDGAVPHYFPMNRRSERTYGRLVVQAALA